MEEQLQLEFEHLPKQTCEEDAKAVRETIYNKLQQQQRTNSKKLDTVAIDVLNNLATRGYSLQEAKYIMKKATIIVEKILK